MARAVSVMRGWGFALPLDRRERERGGGVEGPVQHHPIDRRQTDDRETGREDGQRDDDYLGYLPEL